MAKPSDRLPSGRPATQTPVTSASSNAALVNAIRRSIAAGETGTCRRTRQEWPVTSEAGTAPPRPAATGRVTQRVGNQTLASSTGVPRSHTWVRTSPAGCIAAGDSVTSARQIQKEFGHSGSNLAWWSMRGRIGTAFSQFRALMCQSRLSVVGSRRDPGHGLGRIGRLIVAVMFPPPLIDHRHDRPDRAGARGGRRSTRVTSAVSQYSTTSVRRPSTTRKT